MWHFRFKKDLEESVMRTYAHRDRQQFRMLIISIIAVTALGLLAGTSGVDAQAPAGGQKQAVVTVKGMQCPFCAYGIQKQLKKLPGAARVDVELAKNQAIVTFAPDAKVTDADIRQAVRKAGFTPGKIEWKSDLPAEKEKTTSTPAAEGTTATVAIEGMRCLGCEAKITADLEELSGVSLAQIEWQNGTATVRYDATSVTPEELIRTIERAGKFQAALKTGER